MTEKNNSLLSEAKELRQKLFRQILHRDRLLFIEGRLLEEKYLRLFAVKECAVYELNTQLLCAELQGELTERGMSAAEIDRAVRDKQAERHEIWLAHLHHRNVMLLDGQDRNLTSHWYERLDYYYGLCVRMLHPDLHPNANAKQRQMMVNITRDYERRNLSVLAIKPELLLLEELPRFRPEDLDEAALAAECERLRSAIADNEAMVKTVERAHPYNLRCLLEDDAACAAKLRELDELLAYLREKLSAE